MTSSLKYRPDSPILESPSSWQSVCSIFQVPLEDLSGGGPSPTYRFTDSPNRIGLKMRIRDSDSLDCRTMLTGSGSLSVAGI
jgi:hypothetical protein